MSATTVILRLGLGSPVGFLLALALAAAAAAAIDAELYERVALPPGLIPLSACALLVQWKLTRVDDGVERFLAFAGFSAGRAIFVHLPAPAAWGAASCALGYSLAGAAGLAAEAAISFILIAMMILRVLLYRVHSKRRAEVLIVAGLTALAVLALAMPALAAGATLIGGAALFRRAGKATWLPE